MDVEEKVSEHATVSVEVEAKVMSYLIDCGMDPSTISVKDIDEKSLLFLAEYADNSFEAEDNKVGGDRKEGDSPRIEKMNNGDAVIDIQYREPHNDVSEPDHFDLNGSIQTLSGKQVEITRLKLMAESLKTLLVTNDGSEKKDNAEPDNEHEIDMDELEPWQKALFHKLDKQAESIEKCQEQIQALTKIVALNAIVDNGTPQTQTMNRPVFIPPNPNAHAAQVNTTPPRGQGNRGPVLVAAEENLGAQTFLDKVLCIPRTTYNFIKTSRPIRIVTALRREADNFHIPGNRNQAFLDFHLMFKLAFICVFLRARMGSNNRRGYQQSKGNGIVAEMLSLWKYHSNLLLITAAVIVYLVQTGLILFLYKITMQDNVIGQILRNKDLEEDTEANGEVAAAVAEDQNGARARRGRRDRAPAGNHAINANVNAAEPPQENGNQNEANGGGGQEGNGNVQVDRMEADRAGRFNMNFNVDETFIGGVVDRPFDGNEEIARNLPREEIFLGQMIEGVKDVCYLLGSFFLSIFPMWRPRQREMPEPDPEPERGPEPEPEPERRPEPEPGAEEEEEEEPAPM